MSPVLKGFCSRCKNHPGCFVLVVKFIQGFCPSCKIHPGFFVLVVKFIQVFFVLDVKFIQGLFFLVVKFIQFFCPNCGKFIKGLLSTLTFSDPGASVLRGFCPTLNVDRYVVKLIILFTF